MAREHEVGIEVSVDQVKQKRRCIIYHFYKLILLFMFCVFMILRERARKAYYQIEMVMIMVVKMFMTP